MNEEVNYYYKIVLLGNGKVGKTSLRRNFMGETFQKDYTKTLKADFASYSFEVDGLNISFSIWDLAGQPEFEDVQVRYYYGAFGAILVFDVTKRESFENLDNWIRQLKRNTMSDGTPVIIAANKVDLDDVAVDFEEVEAYVDNLRQNYPFSIHLIKTSALTGHNVKEAFTELAREIYKWKSGSKE